SRPWYPPLHLSPARGERADSAVLQPRCSTSPRSSQRLQFARQRISPLRNIAGAQTDDIIAAAGDAVNHSSEIDGILQRNHFAMAVRAQAEHKIIAVNSGNRRLAGRIDFGNDNGVGIVEAGAKLLEQRLQPGEAMRLHHSD